MKRLPLPGRRNRLSALIGLSLALGSGSAGALQVTGGFTGWWGQPQQENHGVIVSISRRADGSNQGVLYWAHYDNSGQPSWLYAQGPIRGDTIEATMYRFDGITFMQPNDPSTSRGTPVGSMRVTFGDCLNGQVTFNSIDPSVGAGDFAIRRLTTQPGARCSGGVSDNRSADDAPLDFRVPLVSTGAVPGASGKIEYDATNSRVEFKVEIEDVPEGDYELYVGGELRGIISAAATGDGIEGKIEFRSPADDNHPLLDFEPLGEIVEVIQGGLVILEGVVDPTGATGPGTPGDPGNGAPPFGPRMEIEIDLDNTGLHPLGDGKAEFEQRPDRVDFDVEIEDVPVGSYVLMVDGVERGTIEVVQFDFGTEGELEFRNPPEAGKLPLDFDPRGALIEILDGTELALMAEFPLDGNDDGDGDDDDSGGGDDDDGGGDDDDGGGDDDDGGSPGAGGTAEITVELDNTGVYPTGSGDARWRSDDGETDFDVEIEDVPVGDYTLAVGGTVRGTISVTATDDGGTEGEIEFSDSGDDPDELPLDFDPRGEVIEVLEGDVVIFTATLPTG
ncbi:MAG: hypothetical protein Kow0020_10010 [Wenzhouxiangellaceae bacterium]